MLSQAEAPAKDWGAGRPAKGLGGARSEFGIVRLRAAERARQCARARRLASSGLQFFSFCKLRALKACLRHVEPSRRPGEGLGAGRRPPKALGRALPEFASNIHSPPPH